MQRLPASVTLGGAVVAAIGVGSRGDQIALVVAQTASVVWLGQLGWSRARGWATAGVLVAAAWVPTFLIASWIYVVDPHELDVGPPTQALGIVELSLLATICGFVLWRRGGRDGGATFIAATRASLSRRAAAVWTVVALVSLAIVVAGAGGPVEYLRNLNHEGLVNQGKTYFIVLALGLLFVVQTLICLRWSRNESIGRDGAVALVVALVLVGILGARLFIASALVELMLFYGLARRRPRIGRLAVAVVLGGALLVLGIGAVKRYSNYRTIHPGTSVGLARYLWSVAPGEVAPAYANNYADGVRLIAIARATVPRHADFEYGRELLRDLVQPLPHAVRPVIAYPPALRALLAPSGGNSYALPLQLIAYIEGGFPLLIVAFLLLGGATAELDHRLSSLRSIRPSGLILVTALITELAALLRDSAANGVASTFASIVVLYAVARTCECVTAVSASRTGVEPVAVAHGG